MRSRQRKLAGAKRYAEAKEMKEMADELEKQEMKHAEKDSEARLEIALRGLVGKQKNEMICFVEHRKRILSYIEGERGKTVRPMKALQKSLQGELTSEKEKQRILARSHGGSSPNKSPGK
jgi:hypothetical protein